MSAGEIYWEELGRAREVDIPLSTEAFGVTAFFTSL